MSLPDCHGSFGLELPQYDEAVRIAGNEPGVAADEVDAVDLCNVTAKDVAGLSWGECRGLALSGHYYDDDYWMWCFLVLR